MEEGTKQLLAGLGATVIVFLIIFAFLAYDSNQRSHRPIYKVTYTCAEPTVVPSTIS